jgi:hypothetical protein
MTPAFQHPFERRVRLCRNELAQIDLQPETHHKDELTDFTGYYPSSMEFEVDSSAVGRGGKSPVGNPDRLTCPRPGGRYNHCPAMERQ